MLPAQCKSFFIIFSAVMLGIMLSGCSEMELASHVAKSHSGPQGTFKIGNPYTISGKTYKPRETYDLTETGIASWYGPQFHGKQTANGEIYNMHELTAAHRTLQMPSLVRVTNLENGKSVVVRVNDRGPFSRGRVIDVSKKAADLLGFKNQGTAKVRIQLLSEESRRIAELAKSGQSTKGYEENLNHNVALSQSDIPQAPVPGHVNAGRFYPDPIVQRAPIENSHIYIQVGSFGDQANAQATANKLAGLGPVSISPTMVHARNFYRVRLGPLRDVRSADQILSRVIDSGFPEALTVVD